MTHLNVLFSAFFLLQGFGGKFGVQSDRMDKSALTFQENPEKTGTNYTKVKPDIGKYDFQTLLEIKNSVSICNRKYNLFH